MELLRCLGRAAMSTRRHEAVWESILSRAYLQHTPQGDMVIVYLEGDDIVRSFQSFATSQDAFDVWFRQHAPGSL